MQFEGLEDRRLLTGPYAPAAGQAGSTAIHKDDSAILGWATGWENYTVGTDVDAQWQTPAKALGKAVGDSFDIVCLGNGGQITLTFDRPIANGPGWDFAAFENGFGDTFLELGFVEVSSNGADFFRFPNDSLTPSPVNAFGAVDPTNITGYVSKYRQGYGTPFDLEQLAGASPLLDVNDVKYVKLVDIVGDGTYRDTAGHPIYDPHKTVGSGGLDVDAIGVRHYRQNEHLVHFEDLTPDTPYTGPGGGAYWKGPDPNGVTQPGGYGDEVVVGAFESVGLEFNNIYSNTYGSWTGWAYSTTTDTTTEGYLNQFSAYTGGGATGSLTYAVSYRDVWGTYPPPTIARTAATEDMLFRSVTVTNTTYAVLSMLNGDQFAVKFGWRDVNSDGDYDDPEDIKGDFPDWFLLTIEGKDAGGASLGTIEFYLADYRFEENSQDYIVDTWTTIDISPLQTAATLEFVVTSSDVGEWGMNTPAYFALDNVVLAVPTLTVSIAADSVSETAGAAATTATVTRAGAIITSPLTVTLSSSDTSEATVPATVVIPANQYSVQFPIAAQDDSLADGVQTVTVTASAAGFRSGSDTLRVTDDEPTISDIADQTIAEDGNTGALAFTVGDVETAAASLTVSGSSSNTALVPDANIVFGGSGANRTVTVTPLANQFGTATITVTVTDDDTPTLTLTVTPGSVSESAARPAAGFEDVGATLGEESSWNGSDGTGGFESGGLAFNNDCNAAWDSWSGWSYSNSSDMTTPGYGNQYSAVTGAGALGSRTYAVAFASAYGTSPTVELTGATAGRSFQSLLVTNTTYAALSMRDGDAFAKQFGGIDGTEPDWFLLTITGLDADGDSLGTVEFYLADYRSSDPAGDYIVDTWTEVDVSSLAGATQLTFSLSSSDVGAWGMNTPAYFAVDQIVLSGAAAATGTVYRNDADLSGALVVNLSSDDASEAWVPASVTIPAGQASAAFPVWAVDDAVVDGPQTATIRGTAAGYTGGSDTLQVTDNDTVPVTIDVVAAFADGGSTVDVAYHLSDSAASGFALNIFLSADPVWDTSDVLADQVTISDPAELTGGTHTNNYPLGAGDGEIALPGAGLPETDAEYYLLLVADSGGGAGNAGQVALLTGVYRLPGNAAFVHGTLGADQVAVSSGSLRLTVNGVSRSYDLADTPGVRVRAHDGDDQLSFDAGNGFAAVPPLSIFLQGGAGNNELTLGGSPGDDVLTLSPGRATMSGPGYGLFAEAARRIYAYATGGGVDTAKLYDSAGADTFTAAGTANGVRLQGPGIDLYAEKFEKTYAYATGGGTDTAKMYDSAGDDTFTFDHPGGRFQGLGFDTYAEKFERYYAYASHGGYDRAYLFDSAGDDAVTGRSNWYELASPYETARGAGFDYVKATRHEGGTNTLDVTAVDYLFEQLGWA